MTRYDFASTEYLIYFGLTFIIELIVYGFLLWRNRNLGEVAWTCLVLNTLTHPAVVFIWPIISEQLEFSFLSYILTCEAFAFTIEALTLWLWFKLPPKRALLVSTIANLISWSVGAWIQ